MVAILNQRTKNVKNSFKTKRKKISVYSDAITSTSPQNNVHRKEKIKSGISSSNLTGFNRILKPKGTGGKVVKETDDLKSTVSRFSHKKSKRGKAKQLKGKEKLATATLILKNLPPTIDYSQLKEVVPTAVRLELYKKNAKRHAFARFTTTEECSSVAAKLKHLKLGDYEVQVAFASHSDSKQPRSAITADMDTATTLNVSNLPFDITQKRLEEEFPTASQVLMNMNSHGRFRGSCLLLFDSVDDCRTVRDACRGRQIDNRPIRCMPVTGNKPQAPITKPIKQQLFGVKVRGVPNHLDEDELRAIFDKKELSQVVCSVNCNEDTKTVVYKFNSRLAQRSALRKFNHEKVFGLQLRARPWSAPGRRRGAKLVAEQSNNEKKALSTWPPGAVSRQMKPTHRFLTDDQEPSDWNITGMTDDSMLSEKKRKKKKITEAQDADVSIANDFGMTDDSMLSEKKRKKKKITEAQDADVSIANDFASV